MKQERSNFVFLQVGEDPRAALFVQSIRKAMPQACIVQCSDERTPEVPGVDRVFRHKGDSTKLMTFRLECFAELVLDGPAAYLDSDMLMLRPLDVRAALGSADAALCERVFGRDNLIKTDWGIDVREYEGRTFGQIWPILACFNIDRSHHFWIRCRDILRSLPEKFAVWYGDQEALRIVSEASDMTIAKLKESEYACLPHFADQREPPYLLHFKGPTQKDAMFGYARRILGQGGRGPHDVVDSGSMAKGAPTPSTNMALTLEQYERIDPRCTVTVEGRELRFSTPNQMTKWRVDSLLEKEPATISWLSEFTSADIFVDVGANVGMYSVLVAAWKGCRVHAFEPEALNFSLLNRNIYANKLDLLVTAYPAALGDYTGLSTLYLSSFSAGGSCHSLGASVDYRLAPRQSAFVQGCVALRLDDLVHKGAIAQPTRLKIDVDGFEHKVIAGALGTVTDPRLNSLLVEINHNIAEHRALVEHLGSLGFHFDPAQVRSVERKEGPFAGCAEYIFRRSA